MQLTAFVSLLTLSASALALPAPQAGGGSGTNQATPEEFIALLDDAPTEVDRIALYAPSNFKYDFNNPPASAITRGKGGHTVKADRKTFPALVRTGVGMTVGFIGPCGFNTPHTHPRSSEFNIVVQGSLVTNFVAENGASLVNDTLTQYQATVFPQGALHTEFNPNCDSAVFVAGFGHEDPGVLQAAQSLFSLQDDVVSADLALSETIRGADLAKFRDALPHNVALGVASCLTKCGITEDPSGPVS